MSSHDFADIMVFRFRSNYFYFVYLFKLIFIEGHPIYHTYNE